MSFSGRLNTSGGKKKKNETIVVALSQLAILKEQLQLTKAQHQLLAKKLQKRPHNTVTSEIHDLTKRQHVLTLDLIHSIKNNALKEYADQLRKQVIDKIKNNVNNDDQQAISSLLRHYDNRITQQELIDEINNKLINNPEEEHYKVIHLGGHINRTLLVQDPSGLELCTLRFLTLSTSALSAFNHILDAKVGTKAFLPDIFYEARIEANNDGEIYPSYKLMLISEHLVPLEEKINDLHNIYFTHQPAKLIEHATSYTKQVIELLLALRKEKTLWTDLKPSNFLVTALNQIKLGDPKGLVLSVDTHRKNSAGYYECLAFTTEAHLSYDFMKKRDTLNDNDIWAVWTTDEYNYQVSTMLYYLLTNKIIHNQHHSKNPPNPYVDFDFSSDVFTTDTGKHLKLIIQLLSGEALYQAEHLAMDDLSTEEEVNEPCSTSFKRMDLDSAYALLEALHSPSLFAEKLEAILATTRPTIKATLIKMPLENQPLHNAIKNSSTGSHTHSLFSSHRKKSPELPVLDLSLLETDDNLKRENPIHRHSGGDKLERSPSSKSQRRAKSTQGSRIERRKSGPETY